MPVCYLLHPKTGCRLEFKDAPSRLEAEGIMPSYAVEAVIREYQDDVGSFHVRPSDVTPSMTCRRQRVWMSTHEYGVNPLEVEGMLEGSAFHSQLQTHEIEVPEQIPDSEKRLEVCGVPMRGRIDWLFNDRIEDLKTSTPFWITKYGAKGSGVKPWVEIWQPKDEDDVAKWRIQLSIYRVLLEKSGREAPLVGRIWRRYSGVKADKPRWKRFDFALLNESELELVAGEWMRVLRDGLAEAEVNDPEAWCNMPADGKAFVGSRGNQWACDKCPKDCRSACEAKEGWQGF